jgi:uncharacterized protein YbjT (DUF2867 family)
MKVLAIGATGASAGMVVPKLVECGIEVRGLVRDPAKASAAKDAGAVETAVADLNDLDALTAAVEGVDGVFGIIPAFAEGEAGIGVNLVEAAVRAGARKFVFSSVYHPSLTALSNPRDKQPAEAALYESDLDFTILQPAVFVQQLAGMWRSAKERGTVAQAYSADARVAYVHYRDVAEVAAQAFVDDRLAYGTFELAAPGMYSRHDLADLMGEALGTTVTAQAPPFDAWADDMGIPAGTVRDGLKTMTQHYDEHGFHGGNALVLRALLGREPLTVPAYIEELARA